MSSRPVEAPEIETLRCQRVRDGVTSTCTVNELLADADRFAIRSDPASGYVGLLADVVRQLLAERPALSELVALRARVAEALEMIGSWSAVDSLTERQHSATPTFAILASILNGEAR